MRYARLGQAAAAAVLFGSVSSVLAADATWSFSSGNYAAEAKFAASGADLVVTLTNTSTADVLVPVDVLTGVFFDVAGSALSLGRTSATLNAGSIVLFGTTDPGDVVGGEWAYLGGLSGAPHGADYGISSTGLGLFGPGDRFPGTNLAGPPSGSPGGLEYGITSAGDNGATGNTPVTGDNALIKNSVVFVLSGLPQGFDPAASIGNVSFQYGTDLKEPNYPGVPTPGVGLSACLMSGLALGRRRRR